MYRYCDLFFLPVELVAIALYSFETQQCSLWELFWWNIFIVTSIVFYRQCIMTCLLYLYVSTYTRIVNKSNSNKDENNSDSGNVWLTIWFPKESIMTVLSVLTGWSRTTIYFIETRNQLYCILQIILSNVYLIS